MEFRALSGTASEELERLRESGVLAGGVAVERRGQVRDPVLVRPVIGDALAGWMPDLERSLDMVNGVVGISGTDMSEAAGLAADAAAWLGDRGRMLVLVDATVESPVLGKALDEDRDEGLVDAVLFGVSRAAIVRRTLAPGVSVVTVGSHPLSVDKVFEADAFTKMLRALAEDALVLVLVPPVHLTKALGALDAVVCVGGTGADIASLASCTGGMRTIGILLLAQSEAADAEEPPELAHAEEPAELAHAEEPAELAHAEEPAELPHAEEPAELADAEEPAELPHPEEPAELPHPEEPAEPAHAEEPAELPHAEEPAELPHPEEPAELPHAEEPRKAAERPPLLLSTSKASAVSAKVVAPARESTTAGRKRGRRGTEARRDDTGGAEHTPVVLGASLRRRRMTPNHLAATAVLVVIVAIAALLWWFIDGEDRTNSWLDELSRRQHERVVEGRDSEPVEDSPAPPGETGESGTTEETTDREGMAAGGEAPSAGEITPEGEREPPAEEIGSAGLDDSDVRAVRQSPDGGTVIRGPGGRYRIMISSHRHEGAAVFEAGQLIERGVGAEVVATEVENRGVWFRVVVSGGYPMLSAAREGLDTIKRLGYEGAWIERAADNE